jgi:hypothetical protein
MDPRTGETFGPLGTDNEAGEELTKEKLREAMDKVKEDANERLAEIQRATEHVEGGGRLVAVDGDVVQRLRLGDRELARRRRRQR